MDALDKNGTWEMTGLLKGNLIVGYKWVFTVSSTQMDLWNVMK